MFAVVLSRRFSRSVIRAIVTDIEGTTTALSFVHEVLFPYARQRLGAFVRTHAHEPEVRGELLEVERIAGVRGLEAVIDALTAWADADRKISPLITLPGLLWREGYARGELVGHVYEDAARNLRAWHGRGMRLYVYSSGSVEAQRLLFAHTPYGDMTPLFSGYFDTRTGHKREAASYRAIAIEMADAPESILFLSDIVEELDAAYTAGWHTRWVVRAGEHPAHPPHGLVRDFDGIGFDPAAPSNQRTVG